MIVILTAGTMLIFSVSFQFFRMLPEGAIIGIRLGRRLSGYVALIRPTLFGR